MLPSYSLFLHSSSLFNHSFFCYAMNYQEDMASDNNLKKLLIISYFALMLLNSAQAVDVSPGLTPSVSPSPQPVSSPYSSPTADSPAPVSHITAPAPSAESPSDTIPILSPLKEKLLSSHTAQSPQADSAPAPSPSTINNPSLKKICDATDYPSLCLSSLTPFFNGKTDAISVLELAIKAITLHTKQAITAVSKLADASSTTSETATSLTDCADTYNDALDNLQSAMDAIPDRDTGTINIMLSAVVSNYVTCDDMFTGTNPMASYDQILGNMASNCLAIASLIK